MNLTSIAIIYGSSVIHIVLDNITLITIWINLVYTFICNLFLLRTVIQKILDNTPIKDIRPIIVISIGEIVSVFNAISIS